MHFIRPLLDKLLLDRQFARKISPNFVFLTSGIRIEKNLKILLIKATKNLSGGARKEILSSINESFCWSYQNNGERLE